MQFRSNELFLSKWRRACRGLRSSHPPLSESCEACLCSRLQVWRTAGRKVRHLGFCLSSYFWFKLPLNVCDEYTLKCQYSWRKLLKFNSQLTAGTSTAKCNKSGKVKRIQLALYFIFSILHLVFWILSFVFYTYFASFVFCILARGNLWFCFLLVVIAEAREA